MARILVADNDPEALDLAMLDLRLEGHAVVGAPDGETAMGLVERMDLDVVILDYRMPPGPSGLMLGARLHTQHPELRIVLYTNYHDADLVREARESGLLFLPKGDLRRLRAAVSG
jgi:DNA-binding NtrC family response regulator